MDPSFKSWMTPLLGHIVEILRHAFQSCTSTKLQINRLSSALPQKVGKENCRDKTFEEKNVSQTVVILGVKQKG